MVVAITGLMPVAIDILTSPYLSKLLISSGKSPLQRCQYHARQFLLMCSLLSHPIPRGMTRRTAIKAKCDHVQPSSARDSNLFRMDKLSAAKSTVANLMRWP